MGVDGTRASCHSALMKGAMPVDIFGELEALDEARRQIDRADHGGFGRLVRGPVMRGLGEMNRTSDVAYLQRISQLRHETDPR